MVLMIADGAARTWLAPESVRQPGFSAAGQQLRRSELDYGLCLRSWAGGWPSRYSHELGSLWARVRDADCIEKEES